MDTPIGALPEPSARRVQPYPFDEVYVRRLIRRDRFTEDHFCAYFGELLYLTLRARVRCRSLIDDVRQETFVRVFRALQEGRLEHPERLGGFVHSICQNVLREKFREGSRQVPIDEGFDNLPDRRVRLDEPLINEDRKRLVASVLANLPRRDREVLRMVFLEDADKAEVCRRLEISEEYLRVLLHRAKARFRRKLEEMERRQAPAEGRAAQWNQQDAVKRNGYPVHYTMRYSDGT